MIMHAILPLAPSINRTYKVSRGKFYKSQTANEFEMLALSDLRKAVINREELLKVQQAKKSTFLTLELHYYVNSLLRSDIDNRLKITIDTIFKYLGLNDRIINDLIVKKLLDQKMPRCEAWLSINKELY